MNGKPHLVITISRQLGCGGAFIGPQVAKALGMYYANHEIITRAAEKLSVLEEDVALQDEKVESFWKSFWLYSGTVPDAYMPSPTKFPPTSFDLFNVEEEIIRHIAVDRPTVIMGRCGFFVLRNYPNRISILLHAEPEFRSRMIQDKFYVNEEEAKKMISRADKERAQYINTFTNKNWTDATNYHLTIDTSKTGINKSIEIILNFIKSMQEN